MVTKRRNVVRLVVTGPLALAVFLGSPGHGAAGGTMLSSRATTSSLTVHPGPMKNGVIAFTAGYANASLNAIDPTSGRQRSLAACTSTRCYIGSFAWSPDGKRIAFERGRLGGAGGDLLTGKISVFVVNANGGGEKRLARCGSPVGCRGYPLAWAPDGAHLAIERNDSVYVLDLKTGRIRRITHCAFSPCVDMAPAWSPDGSEIAFARSRTSCMGACQSFPWVVNADGSGARECANAMGYGGGLHPQWSPDGRMISFGSKRGIFTVSPSGSHLRLLVPAHEASPLPPYPIGWSPAGSHLLYEQTDNRGQNEAWMINADATGRRRLYHACCASAGRDMTWSPDGRRIAFSTDSGLYLMDVNGTHVHRLLAGSSGGLAFAWQPIP